MAKITIHSPNPLFTGVVAKVSFADGVAVIDEKQQAALEYFTRAGYGVDHAVQVGGDEGHTVPAQDVAGRVLLTDAAALEASYKSGELDELAAANGFTVSGNKGEKIAQIVEQATAKAQAASPTSAPVGEQTVGSKDAADPSAVPPVTTPQPANGI